MFFVLALVSAIIASSIPDSALKRYEHDRSIVTTDESSLAARQSVEGIAEAAIEIFNWVLQLVQNQDLNAQPAQDQPMVSRQSRVVDDTNLLN